jgi:recombination protein RecA
LILLFSQAMNALITKKEVELALADRFGAVFERHERHTVEVLATGVDEIDSVLFGLPRGAITELHGPTSSGRTSLMLSALANATAHEEICAIVDCDDTFDLTSATQAGVNLKRMLWVRCGHSLERAFKAVDLILHAGGFGFIALNLSNVPATMVRRVVSSWWFRFRRAIEDTPTALIVLTPVAAVRSCAALVFELKNQSAVWPSTMSLVSENSNGSFTVHEPTGGRLSLVPSSAVTKEHPGQAHAHFLQTMQIVVNRERPVEIYPGRVKFSSHLRFH